MCELLATAGDLSAILLLVLLRLVVKLEAGLVKH